MQKESIFVASVGQTIRVIFPASTDMAQLHSPGKELLVTYPAAKDLEITLKILRANNPNHIVTYLAR